MSRSSRYKLSLALAPLLVLLLTVAVTTITSNPVLVTSAAVRICTTIWKSGYIKSDYASNTNCTFLQ